MVKQIINIHIIHISLNIFEIDIWLFVSLAAWDMIIILAIFVIVVIILILIVWLIFICFFQPLMREDLGHCKSLLWL